VVSKLVALEIFNHRSFVVATIGIAAEKCAGRMGLVEPGTLVLLVDDDVNARQGMADLLAMEGYEVRSLSSADAAWTEIANGADPALLILDLWIPGMTSSSELVRRLRASDAAHVPVLVLSGSRVADHLPADVDAVSQKPIEGTSLVHLVDKLVRQRRSRRAGGIP